LRNQFTTHLDDVGETYIEHFWAASGFAAVMLIASVKVAIHAIIPCLFVKDGSEAIKELHHRMVKQRSVHLLEHPILIDWVI
jgi:hypothetical protein